MTRGPRRSLRASLAVAVLATASVTPLWALWMSPRTEGWEERAEASVVASLGLAIGMPPGERALPGVSVRWWRGDTVVAERVAGPLAAPDWDGPERAAATTEPSISCAWTHGRFRCAAAARRADGLVVQVIRNAAGADVALWEHRASLLGLAAVGAATGGGLVAWLSWLVRPVSALRDAVVARAAHPRRPRLLGWTRNDELGDLAGAVDTLLAAVHARDVAAADAAADLVHELRNPTAAVAAAADLLAASPDPQAARAAVALGDAARRLDAVSADYLALARAEADAPVRQPVDLAALMRGLTDVFRNDPRSGSVAWTVDLPAACIVAGDPGSLETLARNLLANAVAHARHELRIEVAPCDGEVRLRVENDGHVVAAEALRDAFARWSSRRPGGSGLGVPIARALAEAHGGRLVAEPRPGGGAIFALWLPTLSDPDPLAGPKAGGDP